MRSLGVVYENSDPKEYKKRLQKAAFQSRIYGTKLQYTVTYSIGYYLMKSYFEKKYPDMNHEDALDAHRAFSETLKQNSDFYPGLIRMGLLETGLKYYDLAAKRAKKARAVLKKKGLLTDLEYLNYWLNEMILWALKELNGGNINVTLQNYPQAGVIHCINAGKTDIECVERDAAFLQEILNNKDAELRQLPQFLADCQTLINTKDSAEMKDSYPNIKVIGVGAEFKRNQRNFMISPMGNAFVNYEGKSRILGKFVGNQKYLFRQYHSPLPVDNYTILL
jgi:hypothetical protein